MTNKLVNEMTDKEFIEYLERIAEQHDDASRPFQAETLREAARRIKVKNNDE